MALGPRINVGVSLISNLLSLSILDFSKLLTVDLAFWFQVAWMYMIIIFLSAAIFAFYYFVLRDKVFSKRGTKAFAKSVADTLTPMFSMFAFVPALFTLFEVYICTDEYDGRTYIAYDCEEKCWTATHYGYVAAVSNAVLLLLPLTALLRVEWQSY
jgi:hypothetical protein